MKLYNTLSRQIEEIKPLNPSKVTMYTCGPTVYDHSHIGNLSSFIFSDMLRQTMRATGFNVQHVMNFTDVDDKTIRRSHELYPAMEPMTALLKLTDDYANIFTRDMRAIGNQVEAITFIKATDSIDAMRQLIKQLHEMGFAYLADDGIYFSIDKYKQSGKIYGQLSEITASSTSESRIQNDEYDKESVHDFALWKLQKDGEPAWDFQLEDNNLKGRPGWHIECSAMSKQLLGQPFDIHTGGVDLIFPHHENEIAQSTAGTDTKYANLFAHNEHLLVEGKKMSKSLDNFYTLEDITTKGFSPLAFRLLVIQSHYRKQAHFSWENLEAAQNRLRSYQAMADLFWQPWASDEVGLQPAELTRLLDGVSAALQNDLNTPAALALLSELEALIDSRGISMACQEAFHDTLVWLDNTLGLQLRSADISDDQKQIIEQREVARAQKDWAESDELRDQLLRQGVQLRDTDQGPIWTRLSGR